MKTSNQNPPTKSTNEFPVVASAALAGMVDFILPPENMPQKILDVTKSINSNGIDNTNLPQPDESIFKQILSLLRIRKGTDVTELRARTVQLKSKEKTLLDKEAREHKVEKLELEQAVFFLYFLTVLFLSLIP